MVPTNEAASGYPITTANGAPGCRRHTPETCGVPSLPAFRIREWHRSCVNSLEKDRHEFSEGIFQHLVFQLICSVNYRRSMLKGQVCPARLHPPLSTRALLEANNQSRGRGRFPDPDKAHKRDPQSFSVQDSVCRWSLVGVNVCDVSCFELIIVFSRFSFIGPPGHQSSILCDCNGHAARSRNPGSATTLPCIPVIP
jgi:hypothetical protein